MSDKLAGPPKGFYLLGYAGARDAAAELALQADAVRDELVAALIHLARFVPVQFDGIPGEPGSIEIDSQRNDAARKARAAIAKATGAAA